MQRLSKPSNYCLLLVVLLATTGAFSQNSLDLYTTAARQSRIADRMAGMERFIAAYPTSGLHEDALEFLVWDSLESGQREQSRSRAAELRQLDPQNALALAILAESLSESANGNHSEIKQGLELAKSGIQSYPKLRHPEGMSDGEFIQLQREVVCILDGETGLGFLAQKDYRNARTYLRQSISIKPQDPRYLYGMSLALLEERNQNSQQEGYLYLARVVNLTRGTAAGEQIATFAQHRFEEAGGSASGWNDYLASAVVPGTGGQPAASATVVASASKPAPVANQQPRPQATATPTVAPQPTQTATTATATQAAPRSTTTTTVATSSPATNAPPSVSQTRPQPSTTTAAAAPSQPRTSAVPATSTPTATTAAKQPPLYSQPINSRPSASQTQTASSASTTATTPQHPQSQNQATTTVASATPAPRTPAVTAPPAASTTATAPSVASRQSASVTPSMTAKAPSNTPSTSTATAQAASSAPSVRTSTPAPVQTAKVIPPVNTPPGPAPDVSAQSASKSATILQPAPTVTARANLPYDAAPPESIPEPTFRREFVSRTAPVSMGILLQTEHLTKENRREILAALTDMVRHLRSDDEVFIMAYGKKLNFEQDLTGNPKLLEEAMDEIKPDPGTALLDAVGFAAGHLERIATNKNRLLLVISDGRNTPSKDNPLTLSQKLNTVRVDCIGLDVGGDSARRQLESLAAYSGGQVTFAASTAQLRTAAVQMAEGIGIEFPN